MPEELLPLFPLELVLFPRTLLPLHIFEERYKEMIGECLRRGSEFGIVQSSEKGIVNSGCTAMVERVAKQYPDGRMDIVVVGRRRFEIMMLNDEKEYLRGTVHYFDDEDPEPVDPDLRERAVAGYEALRRLAEGLELPEPELADSQLSFQLAQPVPDLEFRQLLLATKSEAERLRKIAEFLPSYVERQTRIEHVREVAPRNGHSHWPADLQA